MLQLIAATLSLLLLAGAFASGVDDEEDNPTIPTEQSVVDTGSIDFDGTLQMSRPDV